MRSPVGLAMITVPFACPPLTAVASGQNHVDASAPAGGATDASRAAAWTRVSSESLLSRIAAASSAMTSAAMISVRRGAGAFTVMVTRVPRCTPSWRETLREMLAAETRAAHEQDGADPKQHLEADRRVAQQSGAVPQRAAAA